MEPLEKFNLKNDLNKTKNFINLFYYFKNFIL